MQEMTTEQEQQGYLPFEAFNTLLLFSLLFSLILKSTSLCNFLFLFV